MAGFEGGYKGPNIGEKSGIENIPLSNESQDTTKNDLGGLKKQIDNQNNQLNIKIEETIDTFEDLSGNKLDEKQKEELKGLLLKTSTKSGKPNQYLGEILNLVKESEKGTSLNDIKSAINDINNKYITKTTVEQKETTKVDSKNKVEQKEKNNYETESLIKDIGLINGSLKGLNGNGENYSKYSNIVNKLDELNTSLENKNISTEELKKISESVLSDLKNQDILNAVLTDLLEQDRKNGTNNFDSFTKSLIHIEPSLRANIDVYNSRFGNSSALVKLGTNTEKGLEKDGAILKQKTDDGLNIEVGDDGRKIGLSDSEYKLQSDLGNESVVNEIEDKKQEFSKFMKGINEELNSLSSIIDYIGKAIYDNIDINEVKDNIKSSNNELYNELNINNMGSLDEIRDSFAGLYKQKEEEKEQIVKKAKIVIDEIIEKNALNAREKDDRKKQTLKFLNTLGFDSLPQDITDQIINMVNSSSLLSQLGFQNKIDIQNGNLGNNLDNDLSKTGYQEEVKFAEFFNIILTGDKTKPIDIASLIMGKPVFKNDSGQTIIDRDAYIGKIMGINPIGALLGNIEKYSKNKEK